MSPDDTHDLARAARRAPNGELELLDDLGDIVTDGDPGPTVVEDRSHATEATVEEIDAGSDDDVARSGAGRSDRWAARAFAAMVAASFFLLVFWFGRDRWFFRDEWIFLAGRQASSADNLFQPHFGHWTTLPLVVFRSLWAVVGLRAYWPYLAVLVAMHLGVVSILRLIMRRAGVGAWTATIVAGLFLLFGRGEENLQWAFQISFVGALLGGLGHLALADHDGPLDRRDALGLLCGLAGLQCSGVAPVMVATVGLAVLVRRGWRAALVHTVPLAAVFLVWMGVTKPEITSSGRPTLGVAVDWIRSLVWESLMGIGGYPVVAAALGLLLVAGLILAWGRTDLATLRRRAAAPAALLVAALGFFASVANERWVMGIQLAGSSRYVYTGAALMLPALGVAVYAFISRWRWTAPVLFGLVLIGVPGNVRAFGTSIFGPAFFQGQRQLMLGIAASPLATEVPRDVRPEPDAFGTDAVTVGWLLDVNRMGKAADPGPLPKAVEAGNKVRIGLAQTTDPPPTRCVNYDEPVVVQPVLGTTYGITGPVAVAAWNGTKRASVPIPISPSNGRTLVAELPDLSVRFEPVAPAKTFKLCL